MSLPRAAYQVGVLKAIAELLPRGAGSPFAVITGTSAGAVSAIALASDPAHFRHAVYGIERVWRAFRVHQVFEADALSVLRSGLQVRKLDHQRPLPRYAASRHG